MTMRRLWGRANSSNVMKIVWLLEELGLPYERLDVGGPFGNTDTPEYLAMNPNGKVPTLELDDGFILWESNAILRFLCAATAPDSPMWPSDLKARANIDRWMDWQQTTVDAPQRVLLQRLVRTSPERRDLRVIDAAAAELRRFWSILDRALSQTPYVAGSDFTLADIALGVHVHRWFAYPVDRPDQPHLRAWYDRLLSRPVYRHHVAISVA